jgi:hypothetical protein
LLTQESVHEDEDKRAIDISEHQPMPEVPERPEIKEAVFRERERVKQAERVKGNDKTIKDGPRVQFKLPPHTAKAN